jgi:hypothetical protein
MAGSCGQFEDVLEEAERAMRSDRECSGFGPSELAFMVEVAPMGRSSDDTVLVCRSPNGTHSGSF